MNVKGSLPFHVVWHANAALDKMRRIEQRANKSLKGLRWSLLKDRAQLMSCPPFFVFQGSMVSIET